MDDWYEILGINRHATRAEVGAAFRRLAQTCHPDKHPDDPEAASRFRRLEAAFDTLSDAERRREYDEQIRQCVRCRHCGKLCVGPSQREPSWRCQHCGRHVVDESVGEEQASGGIPTFESITPDADAAPIINTGGWRQGKRPRRVARRAVGGGFLTSCLIAAAVFRGCLRHGRENPNPTFDGSGSAIHQSPWSGGGSSNNASVDFADFCHVVIEPTTQLPLYRPNEEFMSEIDRNPAWLAAPLTVVREFVSDGGIRIHVVRTPYLERCRGVNKFYIWPAALNRTATDVYLPASRFPNEQLPLFVEYEGRLYFARQVASLQ